MDTIELDPRLRHAAGYLGRAPKMLINGEMVGAVSGTTFGAGIVNVPEADKADVDIAVADPGAAIGLSRFVDGR